MQDWFGSFIARRSVHTMALVPNLCIELPHVEISPAWRHYSYVPEVRPEELSQPEYATVVGLLLYGAHARRMAAQRPGTLVAKLKSMFAGQ